MTAIQATRSVSTEEDSDLLEKILKDAEELAMKMTRHNNLPGDESVSTRSGDEASESPSSPPKNNTIEPSISSDNDTELEELLKQSETLLGKMRSKRSSEENSVTSAPTTKVEPPQNSPNAPTSVYVADVGTDELSSVGSNSLTSPRNTHTSLRMPSYSSSADPIQEEPLSPCMQPVPKQMPLPTTKLPISTAIPDFTVTSPNAKWEKVESANQGDDDYVPLVDYSKLKKEGGASAKAAATTASNGFDDGATAVSTKQSRVAAFRAQKRRLRKKRQRQMTILILCAMAFGGYYFFVKQSPKVVQEVDTEAIADFAIELDSVDDINEEAEIEDDSKDLDSSVLMDDYVMEVIVEPDVTCSADPEENEIVEDTVDLTSDEVAVLEKEAEEPERVMIVEEPKDVDSTASKTQKLENTENIIKSDPSLAKKCKNPLRRIFNKKCRILAWGVKCQNPVTRIFNKECRSLVRQKRGNRIKGISLQAVAGIQRSCKQVRQWG